MTIEVPKNCRRLVCAYEGQGYELVPSEHPRHLLKMQYQLTGADYVGGLVPNVQSIYITMGRSPLSLLNRNATFSGADYIHSTGNKIPHYTAAERKHAADLVFGAG